MPRMEKGRSSRRHPQVLIGLVVASLLVMIGFQAPSGVKALSKASRLERLQTVDLSRSLSLGDKDCDSGNDYNCRSDDAGRGFWQVEFPSPALSITDSAKASLVAVAIVPQAFRDFASVVPRAPPHIMY
ncbi:hypothetical protein AGR6A_Cc150063 [Agrobacterium sp. NCPPB 925]|nr:hypothetical protein AGR6A_Cc150063 [Agrobacterium sp. NCPPB 925]